jgi:alkylation response protein AidB-like acyl-CoA dehydrogenase
MTEEQEVVREAMADFAATAMRPLARDCDENSEIPTDFLDTVWELGLTSTQIPEIYGGAGEERSPITNVILLEELAHGDAALALAAMAPALVANAIVDQGTEEQKEKFLPALCGDKYATGSLAIVEPTPLFDVQNLQTGAEPKGDGFVISGTKSFVPMADLASHFVVVARSGVDFDAFIVPRDAAGLTISDAEKNLGMRGLRTATLEFDRVEVEASDRLGGDEGCDVQRIINSSRVALAAVMLGVSHAVLDYVVPYAKDREAFDEAIAKKQAIAFMCAEMHIEVEAMRWMVWKAASELEQGLDATRSTHLAREYCAEKSMWIGDNGIQVLGGHGFIREHPVELWFRNVRTLGVLEGAISV